MLAEILNPWSSSDNDTETEIRGVLANVRYHQDGYLIGHLRLEGTSRVASVKGACLAPQVGASYRLTGTWSTHPKWGRTFGFDHYEVSLPTDAAAIVDYLMAAAKWIGPRVGKAIVDRYGADTMQVLKTAPERVSSEVRGITPERAVEIQQLLRANEQMEAVTVGLTALLAGTGLGPSTVQKAIQKWEHEALSVVQADPFQLCELPGVGFRLADRVREALRVSPEAPQRLRAGILHLLREAAGGSGHTFLPDGEFRRQAVDLLCVPSTSIEDQLPELERQGDVHVTQTEFCGSRGYDVALKKLAKAEADIASHLAAMASLPPPRVDEGELNLEGLYDDQAMALRRAIEVRLFVLTGAPGTGKTHLLRRIIESMPSGTRVALAAPTGKAALRMTQQSGREAVTIHRLLEPMPVGKGQFAFSRTADNPLEVDVVILDEVSMVDVSLMASFLAALPLTARLVLVGDTNQLPSVGPGNVLRDVIASGLVDTVELTTIKRQDAGMIIRNCHALRDGQDISHDNWASNDFFWQQEDLTESAAAAVVDLVANRLPVSLEADPIREIQVLCPLREKGDLSCKELNKRLQAALNPHHAPPPNARFALADKVIQTANDYSLGVFNGDIGIVRDVDERGRAYTVHFECPDRTVTIPWKSAQLELAYAITVHKFQGSEARIVVIPIHKSQGPLILQRNWLYTAISRAREVCVCVGQAQETARIVKRQAQTRRNTYLDRLLRAASAEAE